MISLGKYESPINGHVWYIFPASSPETKAPKIICKKIKKIKTLIEIKSDLLKKNFLFSSYLKFKKIQIKKTSIMQLKGEVKVYNGLHQLYRLIHWKPCTILQNPENKLKRK